MTYRVDAVVIGAGVIGLAVARALALRGLETIVLERSLQIGSETSSRNSEVIHAGIYYPPVSLKARLCVRGKSRLYDYLQTRHLAHSRCGKLLVTSAADGMTRLRAIAARAAACGVHDLVFLDARELAVMEPRVRATVALWSPSTGILDSHQFMLSLLGDLESAGGTLALGAPVCAGRLSRSGDHVVESAGGQSVSLSCGILVNATGLHAGHTLRALLPEGARQLVPPQYYARGRYYSYTGRAPFQRLVYPLPEPGGLGIHATLDLGGQVRFGPDVSWIDRIDYDFDESSRPEFVSAIRDYFPGLEEQRLQPAYTGIRPKVAGPGAEAADFIILSPSDHGYPGVCSLHGIESPGLTASLAIAEYVTQRVLPGMTGADSRPEVADPPV